MKNRMLFHLFNGEYPYFPKNIPLQFYSKIKTVKQSCAVFFETGSYDYRKYHKQFIDKLHKYLVIYEYQRFLPRTRNAVIDIFVRIANKFLRFINGIIAVNKYKPIKLISNKDALILHGEDAMFPIDFLNYISNNIKKYAWVCWGNMDFLSDERYSHFLEKIWR